MLYRAQVQITFQSNNKEKRAFEMDQLNLKTSEARRKRSGRNKPSNLLQENKMKIFGKKISFGWKLRNFLKPNSYDKKRDLINNEDMESEEVTKDEKQTFLQCLFSFKSHKRHNIEEEEITDVPQGEMTESIAASEDKFSRSKHEEENEVSLNEAENKNSKNHKISNEILKDETMTEDDVFIESNQSPVIIESRELCFKLDNKIESLEDIPESSNTQCSQNEISRDSKFAPTPSQSGGSIIGFFRKILNSRKYKKKRSVDVPTKDNSTKQTASSSFNTEEDKKRLTESISSSSSLSLSLSENMMDLTSLIDFADGVLLLDTAGDKKTGKENLNIDDFQNNFFRGCETSSVCHISSESEKIAETFAEDKTTDECFTIDEDNDNNRQTNETEVYIVDEHKDANECIEDSEYENTDLEVNRSSESEILCKNENYNGESLHLEEA